MEDKRLKQRLIGAIVLVSLAVIFIPMLLKGPDRINAPIISTNIPPQPERKTEIIPLKPIPPRPAQKPISVIPVEKNTPKAQPEAAIKTPTAKAAQPPVRQPAAKPTVEKSNSKLTGWVVQVGSFSSKNNALRLQKKLRDKQFPAYVEAYRGKNTTQYRVRVGPESSSAKAKDLSERVKKATGINGLVLRHK